MPDVQERLQLGKGVGILHNSQVVASLILSVSGQSDQNFLPFVRVGGHKRSILTL